jgi:hypothetical protein
MRHHRPCLTGLTILAAVLLSGCAPPPPPRTEILVSTTPAGASCVLSRAGQPIATAEPTPAIALVDPSDAEITVFCRRSGFEDAVVALTPRQPARRFDVLLLAPAPVDDGYRVDIALKPRPFWAGPR